MGNDKYKALRDGLASDAVKKFFMLPYLHDGEGVNIWCQSSKGGETQALDVRGWGYLTGKGHGAHGLAEKEAIELQKQVADFIAEACSRSAELLAERDALEREIQRIKRNMPRNDEHLYGGNVC